MKKILIIVFLVAFISCKSKKPSNLEEKSRYEKIDLNEVNGQYIERAYSLAKRLSEACNNSKFKPFTNEEATEKVIQNASVERVSEICRRVLLRNGKFIGLQLIDVTHDKETENLIFKYKIDYEKKYFERQLNVTINFDGKVAAIIFKELPRKTF